MVVYEEEIKATILLENSIGLIVSRKVWLYAYELKARTHNIFKNDLIVHYVPKGRRKKLGFKLDKAVIAEGWQEVEGAINSNNDGEWVSCDDGAFDYMANDLENIIVKTCTVN